MTTILKQQINDNIISNINDFIVGDTSYWKLKYTESVEELNCMINDAKEGLEYWGECSIENTHWLSFHFAFLDRIRYYFELVKCKQMNSYRILKALKKDYAKYHYGDNEYKSFQEYKEKEYDWYCRKFIEFEKSTLSKKMVWEDVI